MERSGDRLSVTTFAGGWTLAGEIDAASAVELTEAFTQIPTVADGIVAVDVAGVTFIDSSGVRILLELASRVAAVGGRLTLRNPSAPVSKIIEITGLESTFGLA